MISPRKLSVSLNSWIIKLLFISLILLISACNVDEGQLNNSINLEISENIYLSNEGNTPQISLKKPITALELKVIDLVVGQGRSVQLENTLEVHYLGVGGKNGYIFDSSFERQETADFPLKAVIKGWQDGLLGMKEGGRRILIIPANQAYGNNPPPGSGISQNETLIFLVDLLRIS